MAAEGEAEKGKEAGLLARGRAWLRAKALKLGQAALLAYVLIDIACYSVLLLVVRSAFKKMNGYEPWQDPKGFLLAAAATWATNNVTRPLRLAAAAGLAPPLDWALGKLEPYTGGSRLLAALAMVVVYGGGAASIVGAIVLLTL